MEVVHGGVEIQLDLLALVEGNISTEGKLIKKISILPFYKFDIFIFYLK